MSDTRKTLIKLILAPVKSERTDKVPEIQELIYAFADISEVVVGVKVAETDSYVLEGEIIIEGYEKLFQLNGVNPYGVFAKQFSTAKLVAVNFSGPRFQFVSLEYTDSLTGSTYKVPSHKLREVNKKLIRR